MKKVICLLGVIFTTLFNTTFADTPNFKKIFKDKDACFILFDLTTNKTVITYNQQLCTKRFSPCSTFKIPLAIMAFDQKILKDENDIIKWDKISFRVNPNWNQDQTPKSWLQNSTVWVSQWIIPQIGMNKIKTYLSLFSYGNQDMSGGLTKAWLSSTLKISANEQMEFLKNLWQGKLPVLPRALALTKKCLPQEIISSSSILYGKTGSGFIENHDGSNDSMFGWFVGYLIRNKHPYAFVTNFSKLKSNLTKKKELATKILSPGEQAKIATKEILQEMHSY